MRPLKSLFGVIGTIVPIIYCGYLLYYFLDTAGSIKDAESMGLGPTLLGLGVVGLFFAIVLAIKIVLIVGAVRSTRSRGPDGPSDGGGFDADAVLARYMARQSTEAESRSPPLPPVHKGSGPAKRTSFGRKVR